jgi:4'-phosphopantetheinyl transferase
MAAASIRPIRLVFDHASWSPSRDQFLAIMHRIQPEERQRVMQFVFRKDVRPSLVGRALLRLAVSDVTGIPNPDIVLTRSPKGKPQSHQLPEDVGINISHQGKYCVLALDACSKVGIDTMEIQTHAKDLDEYFRLMRRIFSASEWDFVKSVSSEKDRLSRFMRLWALKESYVKAEGFGISVDLEKISFSCPTASLSTDTLTSDTKLSVDGKQMSDWIFEETLIDQDHCVAVALNHNPASSRSDGDEPVFRKVTANDLIQGLIPLTDVSESDLVHNWDHYCSKSERPGS